MNHLPKLLTNTKSTEIHSIAGLIINEYENNNLTADEYLSGLVNLLKTESGRLKEAIARIKTKSRLKEKDNIREGQYRSINNLLKGYIHHPEEEIKSAAEKVYKIFYRYGTRIMNKGFAEKSSLINSLLIDLSDAGLQSDIDKLSGLRILIEKLSSAEIDFGKTWVEYEELKSAEAQKESATKIAKTVAAIINKELITYLRAMMQKDKQQYENFALTIGEIINENNINVKKRVRKKEEKEIIE